jgi:hypothetical protein
MIVRTWPRQIFPTPKFPMIVTLTSPRCGCALSAVRRVLKIESFTRGCVRPHRPHPAAVHQSIYCLQYLIFYFYFSFTLMLPTWQSWLVFVAERQAAGRIGLGEGEKEVRHRESRHLF